MISDEGLVVHQQSWRGHLIERRRCKSNGYPLKKLDPKTCALGLTKRDIFLRDAGETQAEWFAEGLLERLLAPPHERGMQDGFVCLGGQCTRERREC